MSDVHAFVAPLLSAYVDGELDAGRRQTVQSHLASCAACSRDLADLRTAAEALGALQPEPAAPDMRAELRRRLRKESTRGGLMVGFALLFVVTVGDLLRRQLLLGREEYPRWFRVTRWMSFGLLTYSLVGLFAEILRDVRTLQEYAWLGGESNKEGHHE